MKCNVNINGRDHTLPKRTPESEVHMSRSEVEHEAMIYTTKGIMPASTLHRMNLAEKERPTPPDTKPAEPDRACPFKPGKYKDARCDDSCALYTGTGCGIVERRMGTGAACPFPGISHCGEKCALYTGGVCALTK